MLTHVETELLDIAYDEQGDANGWPVVLLHGFPYDIHAYDEVTPRLISEGARVIVPYLRGYGPTRFLSPTTLRSGQQAALGADLLALLDALEIERAILSGYDWGGRAACIVAALYPSRARGLVSVNGYNIQDIAAAVQPADPEKEHRMWYQYYLHGERGRAGLTEKRRAFCRLLWSLWSPTWRFDDDIYARTAASFDNPEFVDVVVHSYRHRFGLVEGDPRFDDIERRLAASPPIAVPTITLDGDADGVQPPGVRETRSKRFSGRHENRIVPNAGHNLPQEAPDAFAAAILDINAWTG
ncbi:alpha/beta fold hydrolase [Paraburkholderia silvatlantica]|uniref:Pimeloyl-ACP methyl ester carboxylesterase n=1 Tax=Paraburkholderia silvatlantica TaxID=321895 RepID=A0ABR6FLK4_9BURK|nr:alpha/beta hydrolase [Paraburkholderia silvatlantica]MBB2927464.1 pimeloyl-ACP methyl ester carboxylesterase [Paraburkholderia silvatlantica]PVY36177.1 pimeloyl-ACP methyl ester carboxylesterase [Paraburkholderia silvatlantica]PXW40407.1 pimeloyl-ACP methyl ester carboxylesterase [Paraburkholderia silvatlantica]